MNPWEVLEITATNDKREIKRAYIKLLKKFNPEEDQEGFMRLRTAFEQANNIAEYEDYEIDDTETLDWLEKDPTQSQESEASIETLTKPTIETPDHIDDFFDNFARYSEININSEDFTDEKNFNFDDEYSYCINELEKLLNDNSSIKDIQKWQSLFDNKVLLNYQYRKYFSSDLIIKIKDYLKVAENHNDFSPEVMLLVCNFIIDTGKDGDNFYISDIDMMSLESIVTATNQFLTKEKKHSSRIYRLGWLLFSFTGRLKRIHFFSTIFILFILPLLLGLFTASVIANESNQENNWNISSDDILGDKENIDPLLDKYKTILEEQTDLEANPPKFSMDSLMKDPTAEKLMERVHRPNIYKENNWAGSTQAVKKDTKTTDSEAATRSLIGVLVIIIEIWIIMALVVKRLHDINRSGYAALIIFIPYIGIFALFVMLCLASEKMNNQFGKYEYAKVRNMKDYHDFVYMRLKQID